MMVVKAVLLPVIVTFPAPSLVSVPAPAMSPSRLESTAWLKLSVPSREIGAPPKAFAFALFTESEAPAAIMVGFPRPGFTITLALLPAKTTEPPEILMPLLKVFWPLFENVTTPLETDTRLLKLFAALLLKVRLPLPNLMSEPLAARPPDPPKK